METIEYFKLQAKNLFRDYNTRTSRSEKTPGDFKYDYEPNFFYIYDIISDYDIDEDDFTLMKAQHIIAKIANFDKWADLKNAEQSELELAQLLFEHQDKIDLLSWQFYIADAQTMNEQELDAEIQVGIFQEVVVENNIFDMVVQSYLIKHSY